MPHPSREPETVCPDSGGVPTASRAPTPAEPTDPYAKPRRCVSCCRKHCCGSAVCWRCSSRNDATAAPWKRLCPRYVNSAWTLEVPSCALVGRYSMTWNSTFLPAVRGRLARYLGQLRHNLDAVGAQMREAVAHAVGRTIAQAVTESVYDAFVIHSPCSSALQSSARGSPELSSLPERKWGEPTSERQTHTTLWHDPYSPDDEVEDAPHFSMKAEPDDSPSAEGEPRARRWRQALAAGVQAASWWLRRQRGPASLLAALTVGVVAGLTVLACPDSLAANLVASTLDLVYLHELMCSAVNRLVAKVPPAWTRA